MENRETANILWFDQLHRTDVDLVGGKSSSLGVLHQPPMRIVTS